MAGILRTLASGSTLSRLVARLRRSRSALQINKDRLAALIRERLGEDILRQVQERPGWQNDITARREKVACRLERQSA